MSALLTSVSALLRLLIASPEIAAEPEAPNLTHPIQVFSVLPGSPRLAARKTTEPPASVHAWSLRATTHRRTVAPTWPVELTGVRAAAMSERSESPPLAPKRGLRDLLAANAWDPDRIWAAAVADTPVPYDLSVATAARREASGFRERLCESECEWTYFDLSELGHTAGAPAAHRAPSCSALAAEIEALLDPSAPTLQRRPPASTIEYLGEARAGGLGDLVGTTGFRPQARNGDENGSSHFVTREPRRWRPPAARLETGPPDADPFDSTERQFIRGLLYTMGLPTSIRWRTLRFEPVGSYSRGNSRFAFYVKWKF